MNDATAAPAPRQLERVEITRGVLDLLETRRIYHRPFEGERWQVGHHLAVHPDTELEPYCHIFAGFKIPRALGAFSYSHSELDYFVHVGRYCSIGRGVAWMGPAHPTSWATTSTFCFDEGALRGVRRYRRDYREAGAIPLKRFTPPPADVFIGNDVWIGDGAMIAPGVTIGDGAVIGARALVLKDVPAFAIVGGTPARLIRYRLPADIAERFTATAWWRYPPVVLQDLPIEDPARFIDALDKRIAEEGPRPMAPLPLRLDDLRAASQPALTRMRTAAPSDPGPPVPPDPMPPLPGVP